MFPMSAGTKFLPWSLGTTNLCDPSIPAVDKLLGAHTAITGHVEDHEQVAYLLAVHLVGLALLIPEECGADGSKLVDVDGFVTETKTISYKL